MVSFPNAKINLGLNIIRKRPDGYHDLETVFYPLQIKDALEIIVNNDSDELLLSSSGNIIDGNIEDNLCVKAYRLLKKDFPRIPAVKIHLHKHIPSGAGLGGGSADASSMLIMLNEKFDLGLNDIQLADYGLQLGSDCPFFILNKPCLAKGRGEILKELPVDLSAYKIMLVHPGIHVNTREAFSHLHPADFSTEGDLEKNITAGISQWKELISNDFEKPVIGMHPEIGGVKNILYQNGAVYSAMSGSGSSVYGIFEGEIPGTIKFPSHYFSAIV